MAEYIDREALIAKFKRLKLGENSFIERVFADGVYAIIEQFPAADVAPVVHGRWEKWNGDDRHHCTVCECYANAERDSYGYIAYEFLDNYCPNCGAQMHEDDFCSYGERKEDKAE